MRKSKRGMTWKFVRGKAQVETGFFPSPRLVVLSIQFTLFNQDGPNVVNGNILFQPTTNVNFHFRNLLTFFSGRDGIFSMGIFINDFLKMFLHLSLTNENKMINN